MPDTTVETTPIYLYCERNIPPVGKERKEVANLTEIRYKLRKIKKGN